MVGISSLEGWEDVNCSLPCATLNAPAGIRCLDPAQRCLDFECTIASAISYAVQSSRYVVLDLKLNYRVICDVLARLLRASDAGGRWVGRCWYFNEDWSDFDFAYKSCQGENSLKLRL